MSLNDYKNKIKSFKEAIEGGWFGPLVLVLVAAAAFGLGRWSKLEELRPPVTIQQAGAANNLAAAGDSSSPTATLKLPSSSGEGKYVGSKTGTKYHLPWCSGAQRIKEENKIWFNSEAEAAGKGYGPAANCPGL